ncbi:MAG: CvpA family protein [Oscillospiraceae bacterium]
MDLFLRHILDIITVLIFILCVVCGSRRGIVRMIISVLGFVIAGAAAAFVSSSTYMYVYDSFVKEQIIDIIEEKAEELAEEYDPEDRINELLREDNYDGELFSVSSDEKNDSNIPSELLTDSQFRGTLNKVFTEYCYKLTDSLDGVLPDEIITGAEEYLAENSGTQEEQLLIFEESKASAAAFIEEKIVRPVFLSTIKNVIFAVTFIAVSIIFSVISRMIGVLRHIPAVRSVDSLFGGILGIILGLFLIAVTALLCSLFIKLTNNDNTIINTDIISGTYIFRFAYDGTFAVISALLRAVSA